LFTSTFVTYASCCAAFARESLLALPEPSLAMDSPMTAVHVTCPKCAQDFAVPRSMNPDRPMACPACGSKFEFRQFHEAWCASRRNELGRRFPDLAISA